MGDRQKILIIEDDSDNLEITKEELVSAGYQVAIARDGFQGLKIAQAENPDLIVLDVMLPGIDGYEVCHRLRNNPGTKDTRILLYSAKAREADKVSGRDVGADDYLVKPADGLELRDTLLERVAMLLSKTTPA